MIIEENNFGETNFDREIIFELSEDRLADQY
jgi:hypothetical protein